MELGAFSVSLAVKDIEASKLFYEKLGFTVFAGDQSQNWLIMKNGEHAIGLFQGMFDQRVYPQLAAYHADGDPVSGHHRCSRLIFDRASVSAVTIAATRAAGPGIWRVCQCLHW